MRAKILIMAASSHRKGGLSPERPLLASALPRTDRRIAIEREAGVA
jgi:hypothetical protein